MEHKICLICSKKFFKDLTRSKKSWNLALYCSRKCYQINWKKNVFPKFPQIGKDSRQIFNCDFCNKEFKDYYSNIKPYSHKFCSQKCKYSWMSQSRKGWGKENRSKYKNLHAQINKIKGKANHCEKCSSKNKSRYHWANISGNYLVDPKDYIALCPSCHFEFDRV